MDFDFRDNDKYTLPKHISDAILRYVSGDLNPPWWSVQLRFIVAISGGGLLSLTLCGQFGMGLTPMAQTVNMTIHHSIGAALCSTFCGAMFVVVPVMLLRAVSSPMQFRALFSRHKLSGALWLCAWSIGLASLGNHGQNIIAVSAWIIAAVTTSFFWARIVSALAPRLDFVSPLRKRFILVMR